MAIQALSQDIAPENENGGIRRTLKLCRRFGSGCKLFRKLASALAIGALQLLLRPAGMPCTPANRRPSGAAIFLSQTLPLVYSLWRMLQTRACVPAKRSGSGEQKEQVISLDTILLIVLVLLLVGVLLAWPHARS